EGDERMGGGVAPARFQPAPVAPVRGHGGMGRLPRARLMAPSVVHLVPALFSKEGGVLGGAERYVHELARHMADRVPTRLVTFGPRNLQFRDGELDVQVIGRPWYVRGQPNNPLSLRLLPWLMRATVIHCHQPNVLANNL